MKVLGKGRVDLYSQKGEKQGVLEINSENVFLKD
jgi:hypothetical protein